MTKVEVSKDGANYIITTITVIGRSHFSNLGGEPQLERRTPLTTRQREVFNLVRMGKCNKEIAAALNTSVRTVKFHISSLLAIFRATSRIDLVMLK